jgi:hypothetical protein
MIEKILFVLLQLSDPIAVLLDHGLLRVHVSPMSIQLSEGPVQLTADQRIVLKSFVVEGVHPLLDLVDLPLKTITLK